MSSSSRPTHIIFMSLSCKIAPTSRSPGFLHTQKKHTSIPTYDERGSTQHTFKAKIVATTTMNRGNGNPTRNPPKHRCFTHPRGQEYKPLYYTQYTQIPRTINTYIYIYWNLRHPLYVGFLPLFHCRWVCSICICSAFVHTAAATNPFRQKHAPTKYIQPKAYYNNNNYINQP